MKHLKPALAFLSMVWLTACESVYVEQPLGDEVVVLDQALWQGQWSNGEFVITTSIIDVESGILQAAWIERGEQGAELEMVTGYVRKTGDVIYLSLANYDDDEATGQDSESPVKPKYHWARLVVDEHRAQMWWPNQKRFREAIQSGKLPGTIRDEEDVLLGTLGPDHLNTINSPEANLLNWTEPMVFVRIGD